VRSSSLNIPPSAPIRSPSAAPVRAAGATSRTPLVLGAAAVLAVVLVGYGIIKPDPVQSDAASCGLLVDVSDSADVELLDEGLLASVVDACAAPGGGVLVALAAGAGPAKVASLGTFDLTGGDSPNPTTVEGRRRQAAEAATEQLVSSIAALPHAAGPSDLVGGLAVMADALPVSKTATTITLVTDGLQATSAVSVEDLVDEDAVTDLVEAALALEALDLQGVVVHLIGVNSGAFRGEPLDRAFEQRLEAFWVGVIEGSGGCVATYAPELLGELGSCAVTS
jgi:hypothetical protein